MNIINVIKKYIKCKKDKKKEKIYVKKIFNYRPDLVSGNFIRDNIIDIVKGIVPMGAHMEHFKQLIVAKYSFTPLYIETRELWSPDTISIYIYTLAYNDSITESDAHELIDCFFDLLKQYNVSPPTYNGKALADKSPYRVTVQGLKYQYVSRCVINCTEAYKQNKLLDPFVFWELKTNQGALTYFTYTEKQRRQLEGDTELFKKYCLDFFNDLKAYYDPCNLINFDDVSFHTFSKERFDRDYNGSWRGYYA